MSRTTRTMASVTHMKGGLACRMMRRGWPVWLGVAVVMVGYGVAARAQEAVDERTLAPLPSARALNPDEMALGKQLFFDSRLSGDATLSCSNCHDPANAWTDGIWLSMGYPATLYFRNTPTVLNSAFQPYFYWDGRLPGDDLPTLVRDHISEAHFLQADGRLVEERLRQVPAYEEAFKRIYGKEVRYAAILQAVSAYLESLVSDEVPLDRYLAGDRTALSESAQRGLDLFHGKAGCIQCHHGPMLTDAGFHRLGVPEHPEIFSQPLRHITFRRFFKTLGVEGYHSLREDVGRYAVTKDPRDRGKFRTPSLREVARTPPYMHNGALPTLEEVVAFYNRGGGTGGEKDPLLRPLDLAHEEQQDLVAFLEALSSPAGDVEYPMIPEYEPRQLGKNE